MSHDLLQALMTDVLAGKSGSDVVLVDLLQQYGASRETALDFIHGLRLGNMRITWTRDGRGHFVRLNLHGWLTEPLVR